MIIKVQSNNYKPNENGLYLWKSIFFSEESSELITIYNKKNEKICVCSIKYEEPIIVLHPIVYEISGLRKSMLTICRYLFKEYPQVEKISFHLLSGEMFGRLIYLICGFKLEVKIRDVFSVNNKRNSYYIYSNFRNNVSHFPF